MDAQQHKPFFTPREVDIITDLSEGMTAKQIARHLGITENTVNQKLHNMRLKARVTKSVGLVTIAIREGLL